MDGPARAVGAGNLLKPSKGYCPATAQTLIGKTKINQKGSPFREAPESNVFTWQNFRPCENSLYPPVYLTKLDTFATPLHRPLLPLSNPVKRAGPEKT